jgi:hypothetical protein
MSIEGDQFNRCEVFDEADMDAALARFEELSLSAPRLENAVTRAWAGSVEAFNHRDLDGGLALITADGRYEDRRKGLQAEHLSRDAIHPVFDAPKSWRLEVQPIAIRGFRLGLTRHCYRDTKAADQPITVEFLSVTKVSDDELIQDVVLFDTDDLAAAFAELDARYLAGEAAVHADTWAAIADAIVAHNRRELPPMTPDVISIDHRRVAAFAPGEGIEYLRAGWDLDQTLNIYIEAVHRVSGLGAVCTWTGHGTSHEGFDAEWRVVELMMVEGGLISQAELFDEANLETALARFDELNRPAP